MCLEYNFFILLLWLQAKQPVKTKLKVIKKIEADKEKSK